MAAKWDVVASDLSIPGRSGLDALQQIKLIHPDLPVLILSIHPEEQYALLTVNPVKRSFVFFHDYFPL